MGNIIVSIILFIVAFAILICIHEAGHLAMAKLFGVYCKEYSIGFGPAIFSRRKEGRETKFSIRAIPFGGYVSMYGEGAEDDPDFKDIPQSRSLEGVAKWKKGLVVSAGVILNAILAFILIFIADFAFPTIFYTRQAVVQESSLIAESGVKTGDHLSFIYPSSYEDEEHSVKTFAYEFTDSEKILHASNFFIIDTNVVIEENHYVLTFMFNSNKKDPVFTEGLSLYRAIAKEELSEGLIYDTELKNDFIEWSKLDGSPYYYPNFEKGVFVSPTSADFSVNLKFDEYESAKSLVIHVNSGQKGSKTVNTFNDIGLSFTRSKEWLSVGERFKNTFDDYGSASMAVFKGLKVLFTGGIKNMSGIVGIFDTSASLYTNYAFSTYLFFWALISVNLAIFNLLPFPGLDGWQLLVTIIEGITKKKLPTKFKSIMSLIGLILLFGLMIVIVAFDIMRIIGV